MYMCCSDFLSRELYTRRLDGGTSYSCCPSHFRIQQATIFGCSWLKTECSMIIGTVPFPSGIGILLAIFEKVLASQWGAPVRMLCSLSPLTQFSFCILFQMSDMHCISKSFSTQFHSLPLVILTDFSLSGSPNACSLRLWTNTPSLILQMLTDIFTDDFNFLSDKSYYLVFRWSPDWLTWEHWLIYTLSILNSLVSSYVSLTQDVEDD